MRASDGVRVGKSGRGASQPTVAFRWALALDKV
jgi:hypothetical protein